MTDDEIVALAHSEYWRVPTRKPIDALRAALAVAEPAIRARILDRPRQLRDGCCPTCGFRIVRKAAPAFEIEPEETKHD